MSRPAFPIRISESGPYFEDAAGMPFFWHGDTAWRLFWGIPFEEAARYLDERARQGFTVLQVHMLPHRWYMANCCGERPFLEPDSMRGINEAYFAHVDRVVEYAAKAGLALALSPMWLSTWEDDWHKYCASDEAAEYSRFIAERYGARSNILSWIHGGDDDSLPLHDAIRRNARIMKDTAPRPIPATFHAGIGPGWPFFGEDDWYDFCMAYAYNFRALVEQLMEAKRLYPGKPLILGESHYEENTNITSEMIRRQAYASSVMGGAGHTYGHKDIWMTNMFLADSTVSKTSHHLVTLKEYFDSIPWHRLRQVPDDRFFTVTRWVMLDGDTTYVPAAYSEEDGLLVAYFMDARFFKVKELGEYKGYWTEPVTGRKWPVTGGPDTVLQVPGYNADGAHDWILTVWKKRG